MKYTTTLFLFLCSTLLIGQVDYTANDKVIPYEGRAFFGTNMGYYTGWTDEDLANIAAGNPELGIPGAGVQALRPSLPEFFLDHWGYDIRTTTFDHYQSLGLNDNTVFVEGPSEAHRETESYCGGTQSAMFANIYLDIWDNGENGTPVNDDNYYALYIYKTVSLYKDHVKFWEIWNEPDFSFTSNSTEAPYSEGCWWDNNPDPCEYKLHAPIFHYIRTLRISYEVIKHVDPTAYVAVGGLGYASFLDAILRNTDNPTDGSVNTAYPLGGGAYFDVLSYHSYPHIDNSLREWSNDIFDFKYFRHSDRAVKGLVDLKYEFEDVLNKFKYDGANFPEKLWIITETNLPRVKYGEFIGSDIAQRNYMIKSLIASIQIGIDQYHVFNLAEANSLADENEFNFMGIYKPISTLAPYNQKKTSSGVAYHTTSKVLKDLYYDELRTTRMNLPPGVDGAAFMHPDSSKYTYALWAVTSEDESEIASATYSFPANWEMDYVEVKHWDYANTGLTDTTSAEEIELTGTPIFVTPVESTIFTPPTDFDLMMFPNPFEDSLVINYTISDRTKVTIDMFDISGKLISRLVETPTQNQGSYQVLVNTVELPKGVYLCQMTTINKILSKKIMKH